MADKEKKASDFMEFYIGVILISIGVFFLLNKAVVHSGFSGWTIGGINVSTGLVVVPLMVGIIWLFNNPKSLIARLITIVGSIFIVVSIIMNMRISFRSATMFEYVLMTMLMAAGIGLLLKSLFMARKSNNDNK